MRDNTCVPGNEEAGQIYSIGAVSLMIGVTSATIRNWEARYGVISPLRSSGGQRLYTRGQLGQLRFVKRQLDAGLSPGTAHRELADHLKRGEPFEGLNDLERMGPRVLILLAERDRYAAELEEYFLRTEGYDVELVFDADEALRRVAERPPQEVVVELLISGGTGVDLCRQLKKEGRGPVLAISTLDMRDRALAAGADAFLRKPFEPLQLVSTVKDLLGASAFLGHTR
jgi:CheY-like chemotaxis protein